MVHSISDPMGQINLAVAAPYAGSRSETSATDKPDDLVALEWEILSQELERLLTEGHRGRFALVKQGCPITLWDTLRDAAQASRLLYGSHPCLIQQVLPDLRPCRLGFPSPCRA